MLDPLPRLLAGKEREWVPTCSAGPVPAVYPLGCGACGRGWPACSWQPASPPSRTSPPPQPCSGNPIQGHNSFLFTDHTNSTVLNILIFFDYTIISKVYKWRERKTRVKFPHFIPMLMKVHLTTYKKSYRYFYYTLKRKTSFFLLYECSTDHKNLPDTGTVFV